VLDRWEGGRTGIGGTEEGERGGERFVAAGPFAVSVNLLAEGAGKLPDGSKDAASARVTTPR